MVVLALLVVRGNVPSERAYVAFQSARDLTGLQDLSGLTASPLFLALLAGAGRLGLSIPQAGMILSVAGWLASIAAVYWIGLRSPGGPSGLSRIRESRLLLLQSQSDQG